MMPWLGGAFPPPASSNRINDFLHKDYVYVNGYFVTLGFSALLLVLLVWHVGQAAVKRLWLLPSHSSRILALNAGTLALLAIVAPKPPKPGDDLDCATSLGQWSMLMSIVLLCAVLGAFLPSFAASTDLHDMWSNVTAVGLLVVSVNFITFLQLFYIPDDWSTPTIQKTAMGHTVAMAALFLLFLVLLVQALALEAMMSDIRTLVSQRLGQLCAVEAKPGYEAIAILGRRAWSWEVVEQNTHIKLMMALTSNPQNVMSRSPSAAIVGALVLLCVILCLKQDAEFLALMSIFIGQPELIVLCGFICVWRWVRLALQEDRSFSSLVFAAEPSYWRWKVTNFQCRLKASRLQSTQPNSLEQGQWRFQEVLWFTTASLMLHVVLPLHHLLVALIRFPHILSAVLVQKIIWLPIGSVGCRIALLYREHFQKSSRVTDAVAEPTPSTSFASLGVVCVEGEDACIVQREFGSAARRIVQRHLKKAKKRSNFKHLISLLQSFDHSKFAAGKSNAILDTLNQEGTPFIGKPYVKHHGDQFGWTLTVLMLLELLAKMEVKALGKSSMSENAVTAYWQVKDMMQLVDEQFAPCLVCSKDIYASACTSAWSKIQKKKRRWTEKQLRATQDQVRFDAIGETLRATMERTKRHVELELHNAPKPFNDNNVLSAMWSQEAVISYTMYTVCKNLLTCWTNDVEAAAMAGVSYGRGAEDEQGHAKCGMIKRLVEHVNGLIGEIMACCLSNLPTAVDMSTSEAVQQGKISKIEKALDLVARGKHMWEELQWPTLYSHRHTGLGQLGQWMH